MSLLVGTAGWTDRTLVDCGRFYPAQAKTAEARLRFYALQFPLVEVDSSYYAMPSAATARLWAERTPPGFVFNVKAFRLFTGHRTQARALHADLRQAVGADRALYYRGTPPEIRAELWRRFAEALAPLAGAGKLGLVHFQFPPWLAAGREGHAHVRHCMERMAGHTVSVEFRHRSWFDGRPRHDATLALLRELGAVHTVVDAPQGHDHSVPAVWQATHPGHALVRLHGRNEQAYGVAGASVAERYDYDYAEDELSELAASISRLAGEAGDTHVVFNNCSEDAGQRNARTLMRLLGARDETAQ
jgi:uncharacterized protein YecE (DUF72 family)